MQEEQQEASVVLFYAYAAVPDPDALLEWHAALLPSLGLTGRVRVAPEGVNGTLSGTDAAMAMYVHKAHEAFPAVFSKSMDWKKSSAEGAPFPDLKLERRNEICSHGGTIPAGSEGAQFVQTYGGLHLSPADFHDALAAAARPPGESRKRQLEETEGTAAADGSPLPSPQPVPPLDVRQLNSSNTVVLDVRNHYEVVLGNFEHSCLVDPGTKTFEEFPRWIQQNQASLKGKNVLMYCTGGIRCEKASAYARSLGLDRVYQLKGGIHRYLESDIGGNPATGMFHGINYVFDKRGAMAGASEPRARRCETCGKTSTTASHGSTKESYGATRIVAGPEGTEALLRAGCRICCVCRDKVLTCDSCWEADAGSSSSKSEREAFVAAHGGSDLYCIRHGHLRSAYRTRLWRFDTASIDAQRRELNKAHASLCGCGTKARRRTLVRQLRRLAEHERGTADGLCAGGGAAGGDRAVR